MASGWPFSEPGVRRIGLGTNRLTNTPGNRALLQDALGAGINFIDTAHLYTGGESERTIGSALAPFPEGCIVATKGGYSPREGRPGYLAVLATVAGLAFSAGTLLGGTLAAVVLVTLTGLGFIEDNGSAYQFGSTAIVDSSVSTGPDVAGGLVANGAVNLVVPLSAGAFGAITVTTAPRSSTGRSCFSMNG